MTDAATTATVLWNLNTAARHLDQSPRTLRRRLDADPTFPRPLRLNGRLYFRPDELTTWRDAQFARQTGNTPGRMRVDIRLIHEAVA